MNKEENRRKVLKKRNIRKGVNRLFWLAALIVVAAVGWMTFNIYNQYKETLNWKKNDSSTALAAQSLDVLYDSDTESRESKVKFKELRNKMITNDGDLTSEANTSNVNALNSLLKKIDSRNSEVDYNRQYAEVALKYSLETQYNELFNDRNHETFKSDVTPLTIAKINESTFKDLKLLFDMNHDDKFVKDYIKKVNKLVDDVNTFNSLVELFNEAVVTKGQEISLKEGYKDNLKDKFNATLSSLRYEWTSTEYMSRVVSLLGPINDDVISDYKKYDDYLKDIKDKESAYEKWEKTKDEWFKSVEEIHKKAIAEKRAKEEAERIKKELEESIKIAIDEISLLKNISNDEIKAFLSQVASANTANEVKSIVINAKTRDNQIVEEKERREKDERDKKIKEAEEKIKKEREREEQLKKEKEKQDEKGTQNSSNTQSSSDSN